MRKDQPDRTIVGDAGKRMSRSLDGRMGRVIEIRKPEGTQAADEGSGGGGAVCHWQIGTEALNLEEKPWTVQEVRDQEEVLLLMRVEELQNAARSFKLLMGIGPDWFHSRRASDLTGER